MDAVTPLTSYALAVLDAFSRSFAAARFLPFTTHHRLHHQATIQSLFDFFNTTSLPQHQSYILLLPSVLHARTPRSQVTSFAKLHAQNQPSYQPSIHQLISYTFAYQDSCVSGNRERSVTATKYFPSASPFGF